MRLFPRICLPLMLVGSVSMLTACGGDDDKASSSGISRAASSKLAPQDKDLAELYEQTCKGCHTAQGSTAPQVGDVAAWKTRMAKGMDQVLDGVISGKFGGMPAMGSCSDCNEDQLKALITFMSTAEVQAASK